MPPQADLMKGMDFRVVGYGLHTLRVLRWRTSDSLKEWNRGNPVSSGKRRDFFVSWDFQEVLYEKSDSADSGTRMFGTEERRKWEYFLTSEMKSR